MALTKDELITQGDGICAEVNAAVGALSSSETPETTPGETTEKVANLYIGMIERLQDLGAPEGEEADYAKFMEAGEELAKVEGEAKTAAENEDTAALEETGQEAASALEGFQSQAAIYGFEDCSAEPSAPATSGGPATGGEEFEGGEAEEGGVEPEAEYVEPEYEEELPPKKKWRPKRWRRRQPRSTGTGPRNGRRIRRRRPRLIFKSLLLRRSLRCPDAS